MSTFKAGIVGSKGTMWDSNDRIKDSPSMPHFLSRGKQGKKGEMDVPRVPEFLALNHNSRILGQPSNPVCGFSVMEQVILCAVLPTENWLSSSLNQIQGWTTVQESYSRAI